MFDIFNRKIIERLERKIELLEAKDKQVIGYYGGDPVFAVIDGENEFSIRSADKDFLTDAIDTFAVILLRDFLLKHFPLEEPNDKE